MQTDNNVLFHLFPIPENASPLCLLYSHACNTISSEFKWLRGHVHRMRKISRTFKGCIDKLRKDQMICAKNWQLGNPVFRRFCMYQGNSSCILTSLTLLTTAIGCR